MATLKAVVDHRKADGTYSVKIRLTHNRKSLYIPTSYSVTDRQLTKSKKIKAHDVLAAASRTIEEMRSIIMDVECVDVLPCDVLRDIIIERMKRGKVFRLDFLEYYRQKISEMKKSTATSYNIVYNHLRCFSQNVDVNDLSLNFIDGFKKYLRNKDVADNAVITYLSRIRCIFNMAVDEFNSDDIVNIRVNPFRKKSLMPSRQATEHRVISAEQIRRMSMMSGDRYDMFARDVFLLSFCLIGINLIDLFNLKKTDVTDGVLTYCREKTRGRRADKARIMIRIEDEASLLIDRYSDYGDYLLNFHNRYNKHVNMLVSINKMFKRLRLYDPTLPTGLSYYYARHSWATIAYNDCGIDMQTIHEALNHASDSSMRITDIYVKKDFTRIWEANRKVLDFVFGKEKTTP